MLNWNDLRIISQVDSLIGALSLIVVKDKDEEIYVESILRRFNNKSVKDISIELTSSYNTKCKINISKNMFLIDDLIFGNKSDPYIAKRTNRISLILKSFGVIW